MKRRNSHGTIALVMITAAFVVRGLFLNDALPYGDPLDEVFHFSYAQYFSRTGRPPKASELSVSPAVLRPLRMLPRADALPGDHPSWREASGWSETERRAQETKAFRTEPGDSGPDVSLNYEAQQPPLFYALAAASIHWGPRLPLDRALLALRWLATLCAALVVPLAWAFFRRFLTRSGAIAATAAFVACPGLGSFVGRFSNDALALPIAAGILILLADAARGRLSRRRAIALGVLLAAGCWTKLYFLPLLAAAPLSALMAPRQRRLGTLSRCLWASAAGSFAILPWLVHRRAETGDWFGMHSVLEAATLRIGLLDRLRAVPDLLRPRFLAVFGRTFLWPGTWSAMGAPAVLAVVIGAGFGLLLIGGLVRSAKCSSRLRRRAWTGSATALVLFGGSYATYASTIAAVGRRSGVLPTAGPDGWYVLILLPLLLTAGCMSGGRPAARIFITTTGLFVLAEALLTFGVLPAVYDGRSVPNGANAPLRIWGSTAASPIHSLHVLSRDGLGKSHVETLGTLAVAYPVLLAAGVWIARKRSRVRLPPGRRKEVPEVGDAPASMRGSDSRPEPPSGRGLASLPYAGVRSA